MLRFRQVIADPDLFLCFVAIAPVFVAPLFEGMFSNKFVKHCVITNRTVCRVLLIDI